jgi:hypothetical protein
MKARLRGPVVIDTGVFGSRLTPSGRLLASSYRPLLEGRPAVISFVTVRSLSMVPSWLAGGRSDCRDWGTRSEEPRSSGRGHSSPKRTLHCGPGA